MSPLKIDSDATPRSTGDCSWRIEATITTNHGRFRLLPESYCNFSCLESLFFDGCRQYLDSSTSAFFQIPIPNTSWKQMFGWGSGLTRAYLWGAFSAWQMSRQRFSALEWLEPFKRRLVTAKEFGQQKARRYAMATADCRHVRTCSDMLKLYVMWTNYFYVVWMSWLRLIWTNYLLNTQEYQDDRFSSHPTPD